MGRNLIAQFINTGTQPPNLILSIIRILLQPSIQLIEVVCGLRGLREGGFVNTGTSLYNGC